MELLDHVVGTQQSGLAGRRRAAPDVDGADRAVQREHDGAAGGPLLVGVLADPQPFDRRQTGVVRHLFSQADTPGAKGQRSKSRDPQSTLGEHSSLASVLPRP